ncbi:MAG: rhodanese-like domain-containing protein [Candidatus Sericytochromatia bacterium]|nr:rhodanese-like domain-containing protein [Candidatus Sericytochromatia bacterium]
MGKRWLNWAWLLVLVTGCPSVSADDRGDAPRTQAAPHPEVASPLLEPATIGTTELHQKRQSVQDWLIVDVRSREAFDMEHLPGAISVPYSQIDQRLKDLPRDRQIVLYCA